MNDLRITLVQIGLEWENKSVNLDQIEKLVRSYSQKTDIILLPEMFSTGFSMNPKDFSEPQDGTTVTWMQNLATQTGALIAGSLIIHEGGHYYNRFLAVHSTGVLASYNKRHLFRMSGEESHYQHGMERVVFEYHGWRILPQICYDLRFPVWIRNQDDYDLAVFVANWPEPRRAVWTNLLTARAIENQAYVAGVNRIGLDNKGINHSGESMVVDPKGKVIVDAGSEEQIISVVLSGNELLRFRKKFPAYLDRDPFTLDL